MGNYNHYPTSVGIKRDRSEMEIAQSLAHRAKCESKYIGVRINAAETAFIITWKGNFVGELHHVSYSRMSEEIDRILPRLLLVV